MGVLYLPPGYNAATSKGWTPTEVRSVDEPQLWAYSRGRDGLYVVPIEPGWFVFRLQAS
jgi:hypothetical protein